MRVEPEARRRRRLSRRIREVEEIARRSGITQAEAAEQAIAEKAKLELRRRGLAAEANALMKNRSYVLEAQEVAELMQQLARRPTS
jgi:hypothetical protein